jgi:hypothetical protein
MKPRNRDTVTTIGYVLWRGGLYFTGAYTAYRSSRWILDVLLEIGIPAQIVTGMALIVGGAVMVMASLVVERIEDARLEGDLTDG